MRKFHFKDTVPTDPALQPMSAWTPANRSFFQRFYEWLKEGGYSTSALNTYRVAARLALGYLDKPYKKIDPVTDLEQVRLYIESRYPNESTRREYHKGLLKLAQFLEKYRPKTAQDVKWDHYVQGLPDWLVVHLRDCLAHCRRNWRADMHYRSTMEFLSHLTGFLRWLAAHAPINSLEDITPDRWYDYVDIRLAAKINPKTLNGALRRLQSFLRYLDSAGIPLCPRMLLVDDLNEGTRIPRDAPPEQLRLVFQEIMKETQVAESHVYRIGAMDKAWFLLMLHGGLRTGEVRRLKESDIDWDRRKVRIDQSKGLKDRFVYLSQTALEALRAYSKVRGTDRSLPDTFFVYRHEPLSARYCGVRLKTYGSRCGVTLTPHQLRHSCGTLLLNAGAPILTVQAILGHKHIDTTLNYARLYDGTVAADYHKAMAQVESRLALEEPESGRTTDLREEVLALLEAMQKDALTENQTNLLQHLKIKLMALEISDVKVLANAN
jgi:site-specific recombinase XerD